MTNTDWKDWQKQVLHEEYVKPELLEEKLKKKMEEVNRKYNPNYYSVITNK
ncbi:hypothetical protein [Halalkalibacterium ligniniphilum]|uniref:hypothetical protein n=1 Tax=Halalkalibacterium ligniniphilum TaxID=1134413 RepID=UPI00034703FD|nr:hypothetical protein [Halalkalibacterium ligniniphilum]